MSRFRYSSIFAVMLAIVIAVAGVEVIAQGKGHGRGGDKQHGGQRAERRSPDSGDRGRGRVTRAPQAARAESNRGWQSRGSGNDIKKDRPTAWQGRESDRRILARQQPQVRQRQIWHEQRRDNNDRRARGNDRRPEIMQRQTARQPQIIPAQKWRFPQDADRLRGRDDRRRGRYRDDRGERLSRTIYSQRPAPGVHFSRSWPENYGQIRRAEVHQRNAERKALKDLQRRDRSWNDRWDRNRWFDDRRDARRRWAGGSRRYSGDRVWTYRRPGVFWHQIYSPAYRTQTYRTRTFYDFYPRTYAAAYPYSYDGGYPRDYYDYDSRPSGADILRNVIFAALGGFGTPSYDDGGYYPYSGLQPSYYDNYSPQFASNNGAYYPAGYSYGDPYYDPYLSEDPYYGEVLPVDYFVSNAPGGGLFERIFGQLLAIGYDQGYRDGVNARRIRERDRTFYDPYAYDNAVYDPYSVSLGYNRRCLSQGYELGYEDALNNVGAYDQFQDRDIDLVSVLIGTVSQLM